MKILWEASLRPFVVQYERESCYYDVVITILLKLIPICNLSLTYLFIKYCFDAVSALNQCQTRNASFSNDITVFVTSMTFFTKNIVYKAMHINQGKSNQREGTMTVKRENNACGHTSKCLLKVSIELNIFLIHTNGVTIIQTAFIHYLT